MTRLLFGVSKIRNVLLGFDILTVVLVSSESGRGSLPSCSIQARAPSRWEDRIGLVKPPRAPELKTLLLRQILRKPSFLSVYNRPFKNHSRFIFNYNPSFILRFGCLNTTLISNRYLLGIFLVGVSFTN